MRRLLVHLLAALAIAGCASDGQSVRSTRDTSATSTSAPIVTSIAPSTTDTSGAQTFCEAVQSLREQRRGPDLTSLVPIERSVVEARIESTEAAFAEVKRASENAALRQDLDNLGAMRRWIGESLLANWGVDGVDLLTDADVWGGDLSRYVSRDGIDAGGDVASWGDYSTLQSDIFERMSLLCDERPVDWVAVSDLPDAQVPADLRYAMVMYPSSELKLMLGSGRVPVFPFPSPDPDLQFTNPVISPDGRNIVAVGFDGEVPHRAFAGRLDSLPNLEQISPDDEAWNCVSWSPDSGSVVTTRLVAPGRWKQSRYDMATREVVDLLDREFASHEMPCGALIDEDTLLVTDTDEETGLPSVWSQEVGTDERELFVSIPDCSTIYPQARPSTSQIAVITACANTYDSGLWIVDGAGAEPRHVLKGLIAAPAWSDDGEWILFGYQSSRTSTPELWIATADGSAASQLISGWSSWPAWIPAATECPICPN